MEQLGVAAVILKAYNPGDGLPSWTMGIGTNWSSVQSDSYSWDLLGNLISRDLGGNNGASVHEEFGYDALNRLTSSTPGSGTPLSVSYLASGNISTKSDVFGSFSYGLNAGPHAVTGIDMFAGGGHYTITYDADGNQQHAPLPDGRTRDMYFFSFNKAANATSSGPGSAFALANWGYGPDHEMITQTSVESTATGWTLKNSFYAGEDFELLQLTTAGTAEYRNYVRAHGRLVAIRTQKTSTLGGPVTSTVTRFALTDHLGSITGLVDPGGNVVDRSSFDAWGKRRAVAGSPGNEIATVTPGFTSQSQIDVLGLVNMGGRMYDPFLGRFTSADPFVPDPECPQSLNRYSYVNNNPLSATDPTGYFPNPFKVMERAWNDFLDLMGRLGQWFGRFWRKYGSYITPLLIFVPYVGPLLVALGTALQVYYNGGTIGQIILSAAIAGIGSVAGLAAGPAAGLTSSLTGGLTGAGLATVFAEGASLAFSVWFPTMFSVQLAGLAQGLYPEETETNGADFIRGLSEGFDKWLEQREIDKLYEKLWDIQRKYTGKPVDVYADVGLKIAIRPPMDGVPTREGWTTEEHLIGTHVEEVVTPANPATDIEPAQTLPTLNSPDTDVVFETRRVQLVRGGVPTMIRMGPIP
jgi:RHS repeat-associated protein